MFTTRTARERLEAEEAPARPQPSPPLAAGLTPATVLALQRAGAGNHALARTLARSTRNRFVIPKDPQPVPQKPKTTGGWQAQASGNALPQRAVEREARSFAETQRLAAPKPVKKQPTPVVNVPVVEDDADQDPNVSERDRLIQVCLDMIPEGEYALTRIQQVSENADIRKQLTDHLALLGKVDKLRGPKADVKNAISELTNRINRGEKLIDLAYPLPPKAARPSRKFNQVKQNIELRMMTEPWSGSAKGGVLDVAIDPDDHALRDQIRAEFPRDRKIEKADWPGKQYGDTAYYYVTATSLSGYAYDITAHAFPSGRTPTASDRGKTVHVLHFPKVRK